MVRFDFRSEKNPNSKYNEDLVYVGKNMAWVLDGASSLTSKRYTKNNTDAIWMVEKLDELLREYDGKENLDLKDLMKLAVLKIRSQFESITDTANIPLFALPSCSLCVVRWDKDETKIEYLVLGDCEIAIFLEKNYQLIADNTIKELDNKIIKKMNEFQDSGYTHTEARQKVQAYIIKNRSMMNKKDGYWIFSFDDSSIDHSLIGILPLKKNTIVILSSDGFNGGIGNFQIYSNWRVLMDDLKSHNLTTIFKKIRLFESQDLECLKLPRIKKHDDASAAILEF